MAALETEHTHTQISLREVCLNDGSIYVGSTKTNRFGETVEEHINDGFRGTLHYADTENMRLAEGKLFKLVEERKRSPYRHNAKQESIRRLDESGYVYIIKGQRRGQKSNLKLVPVDSQKELHDMCKEDESLYPGASKDGPHKEPLRHLEARTSQHEDEGYSGTCYYVHTENMHLAEKKLLRKFLEQRPNGFPYTGTHTQSNMPAKPGYVYLIWGRKYRLV